MENIKLDFIKLQEGEQIHFAGEQVVDSIAFGHSEVTINTSVATKGALPAKADIVDDETRVIGKIFLEYEVLRSEVTYLV